MARNLLLICAVILLAGFAARAPQGADEIWSFAVSGDSRNCGDVVMPAIAKSVLAHGAVFYWHLGDFRLGTGIDEDMQQLAGGKMTLDDYHSKAWDDFIAREVDPFGPLPVRLGIGNHELYMHGSTQTDQDLSHAEFIPKFSKWMGGSTTAYYHWKLHHVDFIYLDNSMVAGFGKEQLLWLQDMLTKDAPDPNVHAVVVGMHRALPNSLACGHSMSGDSPLPTDTDAQKKEIEDTNIESTESGREAYTDLARWKKDTSKPVYVLASHSHFVMMEQVYDTPYWRNPSHGGVVLPGWIVGTAGAKRYPLPPELASRNEVLAKTYTYGYLLAAVHPDGQISFEFKELTEDDVPHDVTLRYGKPFVDFCFYANRAINALPPPPLSCKEQ